MKLYTSKVDLQMYSKGWFIQNKVKQQAVSPCVQWTAKIILNVDYEFKKFRIFFVNTVNFDFLNLQL